MKGMLLLLLLLLNGHGAVGMDLISSKWNRLHYLLMAKLMLMQSEYAFRTDSNPNMYVAALKKPSKTGMIYATSFRHFLLAWEPLSITDYMSCSMRNETKKTMSLFVGSFRRMWNMFNNCIWFICDHQQGNQLCNQQSSISTCSSQIILTNMVNWISDLDTNRKQTM